MLLLWLEYGCTRVPHASQVQRPRGLAACKARRVMETGRRQKQQNSRQISIVELNR